MPDEIYGVMAVKNGQKQTIMNLSNARQKSYADLQTMTDAQKKGVIVCPDYPKEEFLVTADEVSYGSGTVKDALDKLQDDIIFVDDTTKYNLPAVGASIDVTKTVTPPTGYSLVGIINTSSGTSSTACMPLIVNGNAYITVLNVSNSGQVGTERTMTWSNIFKKL